MKRFTIRTTGIIALSTALALSAMSPIAANAEPAAKDLTFIVTQDFHGRIDANTVQWAGTVEQIRAAAGEDHSIFLSAGDNFGNSLYASSVQGERPTIDVLNALDLQASAVGNGDTFIGYDAFVNLATTRAAFPYLSANMVDPVTEEPEFDPYVIREVDGVRIGIIGVTTPDTQVQFPGGDPRFTPTIEALNRTAEGIKQRAEADLIVALVHDGGGQNATLEAALSEGGVLANIITQASPLVSALFTAHTHNQYVYNAPIPGEPGRTRPVIQAGSFGALLGKVTLSYDPATSEVVASTASIVPRTTTPANDLVSSFPRVAEVKSIVDQALAYAQEQGSRPAGKVTQAITTASSGGSYVDGVYTGGSTGNRTLESALGTLVANMFRDEQRDQAVPPQFGVTIPNFIRSDLTANDAGEVPVAKVIETFGIRDAIASADITGEQLKRLLEQQWQRTAGGEAKGYIQLALSDNLTYTYDDTRPEGERITSITLDGSPVDMTDTSTSYRMGMSSFISVVNFHVRNELTNVVDSGRLDVDGFMHYLGELSASGPVAPNFMKHGAKITGLDSSAAYTTGGTVEFDVASLNLTSLGAPEVTSLDVRVGGRSVSTVPVANGAAHVSVTIPEASGASGAAKLELVTANGSVIRVPATVSQIARGAAVARPTVTGPVAVGRTVTARLGTWAADYRLGYQWTLNGRPIAGATRPSYRVLPADAGKRLAVAVTAERSGQPDQVTASASRLVTKAAAKLSVTAKAGSRGKAALRVRLSLPGTSVAATRAVVRITDGTRVVKKSVTLKRGAATIRLRHLGAGKHTFTVKYSGSSAYTAASRSVRLTVR